MNAIVQRKFYVLSGQLQATLLAETDEQAAIIAVEKFRGDKALGPYIAVNEAGFESLTYFTIGNPRCGRHFITSDILDKV